MNDGDVALAAARSHAIAREDMTTLVGGIDIAVRTSISRQFGVVDLLGLAQEMGRFGMLLDIGRGIGPHDMVDLDPDPELRSWR